MADKDGRLKSGDEIIRVGSHSTVGESHHRVVSLIKEVPSGKFLDIGVRRKPSVQGERVAGSETDSVSYNHNYKQGFWFNTSKSLIFYNFRSCITEKIHTSGLKCTG